MFTRAATAVARPLRRGAMARAASSRVASVLSASQQSTQLSSESETTRSFSSYHGGGAQSIQRAYPQYNVHGESHMLSFKLIPPSFRMVNATSMATDNKNKGRILLEFTPRGHEGQYQWSDQVRFGLSAEEVGLFLSQLPQYGIELCRNVASGADYSGGGAVSNDMPDKVLHITPGEGAAVRFQLDYVRDGVGGQSPGVGQDGVRSSFDRCYALLLGRLSSLAQRVVHVLTLPSCHSPTTLTAIVWTNGSGGTSG